jgi:hypothetical protein
MLYPFIGPRLHGWLDDLVTLTYLVGAWLLGLSGAALVLTLGGAATHFLLTRLTDYPQGTWRVIRFTHHAYIELGEGVAILIGAWLLLPAAPIVTRLFIAAMATSQLFAFAFSDYGTERAPRKP